MTPLIAIDIGSGMTKAMCAGQRVAFESCVGPCEGVGFDIGVERPGLVVRDQDAWYVGKAAVSQVPPHRREDTLSPHWAKKSGWLALVYGAIAALNPQGYRGALAISTGLPQAYHRDQQAEVKARLVGEHRFTVDGVAYEVTAAEDEVWVAPQVMACFFSELARNVGIREGRRAFLDCGTYTMGYALIQDGVYHAWASGSRVLGLSSVAKRMQEWLKAEFGVVRDLDTVYGYIRNKRLIHEGRPVDLTKHIQQCAFECGSQEVDAVVKAWGGAGDIDVAVAGGTGELFFGAIKSHIPHARLVAEREASMFEIVNGYFQYGRAKLKANDRHSSVATA